MNENTLLNYLSKKDKQGKMFTPYLGFLRKVRQTELSKKGTARKLASESQQVRGSKTKERDSRLWCWHTYTLTLGLIADHVLVSTNRKIPVSGNHLP